MKKLTILDIAKLSGVGKSTVSRVLNNDPKVSQATRNKVKAVIDEHQFIPSRSAQSMRSNESKVIGIIVTRLDSPSENSVVREILPVLYQQGFDVVIMESKFDHKQLVAHLATLQRRHVDGLIVFGFSGFDETLLLPIFKNVVLVSYEGKHYPSVCYDNTGSVELVMDYLYQQGLRHIAYIGVDESDAMTGKLRLDGYLNAIKKYSLKAQISTGELSYLSGYSQVLTVLNDDTQGIVCATDTLALGVAKKLHLIGRNDVKVTGIGGSELLKFMFPETVSVNLGYASAGSHAAKLLLEQLYGTSSSIHYLVPIELLK